MDVCGIALMFLLNYSSVQVFSGKRTANYTVSNEDQSGDFTHHTCRSRLFLGRYGWCPGGASVTVGQNRFVLLSSKTD